MGPLKAPGPNGFQATFYQKAWPTVGDSVAQSTIQVLEGGGELDHGMAEVLLLLIPKTNRPETIKQFRPLSLCNVTFQLVTKVLVNRLKELLKTVISPTQSSFVPGMQIIDNVVICQEMVHSLWHKRGRKGGMILKIDLDKAYDRLEWSFIQETLLDAGLPRQMVNVIMQCVTNASFRLLWNGELTDGITQSRGVRQGDPLSPYIFVLCLERLAHRIMKEVAAGAWKPLKASRHGPAVSYLFFADDLMLFVESSP